MRRIRPISCLSAAPSRGKTLDALGIEWRGNEEHGHRPGRGGCWFESGRTIVHLGVQKDFIPALKAHPAFTVSDLGQLRERLTRAGYKVNDDDSVPGVNRFYVSDPFGNRLEFIQDGQGFSQRSEDWH